MSEEIRVDIFYALSNSDIVKDELGRIENVPLSKALKIAESRLKGVYLMVKLLKRR